MIGVCLLATLMLTTTSFAAITRSPLATNSSTSRTTPLTISTKLRKALIEALNSYDTAEDSTESIDDEATTLSSTEINDIAEASTTTENPSSVIKIHTFSIDGDNSDENEVIKTIIITRPKTTLTPPKQLQSLDEDDQVQIKFGKSPDPVAVGESDNSDNLQQVRSVESRNSLNTAADEKKGTTKTTETKKKAAEKAPTTTPSITTTTIATVANNAPADGEKVSNNKDEVKIQQAPLLAAFTVQQDANGKPHKVISLLQKTDLGNTQSIADGRRIVNLQFRASQPVPQPTFAPLVFTTTTKTTSTSPATSSTTQQAQQQTSTPSLPANTSPGSEANQQIIRTFEENQRRLEEQIRILVARQREQEEIIRRHQQLQNQLTQQKDEQFKQHVEEQRRRQRLEQEQQQLQRQQQSQQLQQPQAQALIAPPPSNTNSVNVQFIPSIQVGHTVGISVEQQPPFKDPIEFHPENPNFQKNIQRFQFRQFQQQQQRNSAVFGQQAQQQQQAPQAQPLIQQVEVQQLNPAASPLPSNLELPVRNAPTFNQVSALPTTLELPQKPVAQFQQFQQQINSLPPLTDIIPPSQTRPRVFRNDALQTGNFGFNSNNNNVQIQQHQVRAVDNSFDNQLFNQFLQSGINTRSTEDFRLISKILAYNHGTNQQQQQQNVLFANNQG